MKKYKVISKCPVCKGDLSVRILECDTCHTKLEGNYKLSKFDYLDDEQLYFVELFIKNKGSIKAVEKDLNVSYPTVKKYLDDVIVSLGYQVIDDLQEAEVIIGESRSAILEDLKEKKLSFDEALEKLRKLGGKL